MKIGRKFNTLTLKEYFFYIDNYKKCADFNTLGLYRSIPENDKLSADDKIAVRDYAHRVFRKTFEFLQLKDPQTFVDVSCLGQELTKGDERKIWDDVKRNQQKILTGKRIRHRNFGDYSKHNCGRDSCNLNGLMIRQGSSLGYGSMHFEGDKNRYEAKYKSDKRRTHRKRKKQLIRNEVDNA